MDTLLDINNIFDAQNSTNTVLTQVLKLNYHVYLMVLIVVLIPQLRQNQLSKSIIGIAPEYPIFTALTYFEIFIYTLEQNVKNGDKSLSLMNKDLLFNLSIAVINGVMIFQYWKYERCKENKSLNKYSLWFLVFQIMVLVIALIVQQNQENIVFKSEVMLGMAIIGNSITKYYSQFLLNQKRKSTEGMNMYTIGLDTVASYFFISFFIILAVEGSYKMYYPKNLIVMALIVEALISVYYNTTYYVQRNIKFKEALKQEMKKRIYGSKKEQRIELSALINNKLSSLSIVEDELKKEPFS